MQLRGRLVEYLTAVAEEGQLTRAARRLEISQPALSQAISSLEAELGVRLLERRARGVALTAAGDAFLARAGAAVAADDELARTAEALSRSAQGAVTVGFIGPPPMASAPELFGAFAESHPQASLSFVDMPFPAGPTGAWLGSADAAFCHAPEADEGIGICVLRTEERAVLAGPGHPIAARRSLRASDLLEETFVGFDPAVQRDWSAFHTLDDVRGGPPANVTGDGAATTLHMLGIMSASRAVTVVPHSDGRLAATVLPSLVTHALPDAAPAMLSLVWREDNDNPLLHDLVVAAREAAGGNHAH